MPTESLRQHALAIWEAGVRAVDSRELVAQSVKADANSITVGNEVWHAQADSQVCVVGGGKAGSGMAVGLIEALGPEWMSRMSGWVNVPAGTESEICEPIHLHAARPTGVNEPRPEGIAGTQEILRRVAECRPQDLCLVLLSGGGSALLPALRDGIELEDKVTVVRNLSAAGANIQQLNAVRSQLSAIKGGGLLRACNAGLMLVLIISDVIGDPLDVIASGPCYITEQQSPQQSATRALEILTELLTPEQIPTRVLQLLNQQLHSPATALPQVSARCVHQIVGNNHTAVSAAVAEAQRRGIDVLVEEYDQNGIAREEGSRMAEWCLGQAGQNLKRPVCLISGGEPTVRLSETTGPRRGGRNQELVLAALQRLSESATQGIALLSGGTDGEDGPTDAAGAFVDNELIHTVRQAGLSIDDYLQRNDSYTFFEQCGGLLKTGPTGTNVMDLRVAIIDGQDA
ncbi:MAG: DUF4147 domain-containing protein [Planctomycetaceae bacterium]|nr:DUF4147 domain-containing protein [Planctomycetaceae bacterium]MCB9950801.1 DUF4147 domain-containing protein [Planctomycetaceae bacterium]